MPDPIFNAWLAKQLEEGTGLARESDVLALLHLGDGAPQSFVANFSCKGLVQEPDGSIAEAHQFMLGISFARHYLRHADPYETLSWLGPRAIWHPNISNRAPVICVGRITPGTPLVDLLYQTYELITYHKYTLHDCLNPAAAAWARVNLNRFPIDPRPLKRRRVQPGSRLAPSGGTNVLSS